MATTNSVSRGAPSMSRLGFRGYFAWTLLTIVWCGVALSRAQDSNPDRSTSATEATQGQPAKDADPLKRPLTEKQKKSNSKALKIELSKTYRKWLDEDVRWIITDE